MHVVPLPVVRTQKIFHMTPRARHSVCVGACTLVNEANEVVNGAVRVTFRVEIPVRSPTITDDRNAGCDPSIYNGHQSAGGSVRNVEHRSSSLCLRGRRGEESGPELHDQDVAKEALYNIVQRNEVLLLNLCIIKFFSKK